MIQLPCTNDALPAAFKVLFPNWKVTYFRQKDGYFGVPEHRFKKSTVANLGHHICLTRGPGFGKVTPSVTTNLLARAKGEHGKVSKKKYEQVLRDVVGSVKKAFAFWDKKTGESLDEVQTLLPSWLVLGEGPSRPEETRRCRMGGVPEYLLEFLETCNMAADIDTLKLGQLHFHKGFIRVAPGHIGPYARRQLKINRVTPGIIDLLKEDRLTLRPIGSSNTDHTVINI